jgi:hypothetical protein
MTATAGWTASCVGLVRLAVAWNAAAQQLEAGQTTERQSSNDSGVTRLTACRICGGTALKAMRWTLVQHQRQDRRRKLADHAKDLQLVARRCADSC